MLSVLRRGKSGKEINGTVGADATDGIVEANATTSESGGPLGAVAIVCGGTDVPLVETGADDY